MSDYVLCGCSWTCALFFIWRIILWKAIFNFNFNLIINVVWSAQNRARKIFNLKLHHGTLWIIKLMVCFFNCLSHNQAFVLNRCKWEMHLYYSHGLICVRISISMRRSRQPKKSIDKIVAKEPADISGIPRHNRPTVFLLPAHLFNNKLSPTTSNHMMHSLIDKASTAIRLKPRKSATSNLEWQRILLHRRNFARRTISSDFK